MLQEFQWHFKSGFLKLLQDFSRECNREKLRIFTKELNKNLLINTENFIERWNDVNLYLIAFMWIFNFQEDRSPKTWDGANIMAPKY